MANPRVGEVAFDVGGKRYVLKLGTYALAALERRVKMPWLTFIRRPQEQFGVDDTLAMVWAGLLRQHKLTEEQVADLIDELGAVRLTEIMTEAIRLIQDEQQEGTKSDPPPPAEANGIGTVS